MATGRICALLFFFFQMSYHQGSKLCLFPETNLSVFSKSYLKESNNIFVSSQNKYSLRIYLPFPILGSPVPVSPQTLLFTSSLLFWGPLVLQRDSLPSKPSWNLKGHISGHFRFFFFLIFILYWSIVDL